MYQEAVKTKKKLGEGGPELSVTKDNYRRLKANIGVHFVGRGWYEYRLRATFMHVCSVPPCFIMPVAFVEYAARLYHSVNPAYGWTYCTRCTKKEKMRSCNKPFLESMKVFVRD